MNMLITGGAGFIGSHLARHLQEGLPRTRMIILDDFRSGRFDNLAVEGPTGWSFDGRLIARSLNGVDLNRLIEDFQPDVIFHEASITDTTEGDQARMIRENVEPFEALLEAVVQYGVKLVWASSAATYGIEAHGAAAARRPFQREDAGRPANVYGFSKWLMENHARRTLAAHPEVHVVGLRYFNVFGPGEGHKGSMASMIHKLAHQMLEGRRPRIFHDGEQARDQVYVRDVVEATVAAADDRAVSGVYNVGAGVAVSFNRIVDLLNEALGTDLAPEYFENPYAFYQDYTRADLSATEKGLGWKPRYSTEQAIREYAEWMREGG